MLLDLANATAWMAVVAELIGEHVQQAVLREIATEDPERMFDDDLVYLERASQRAGSWVAATDWEHRFEAWIHSRYDRIRGFHACRTASLEPYRLHGLRLPGRQLLKELAGERLIGHADRATVERHIDELPDDRWDSESIYFFADVRSATEAGLCHYAVCGSETLQIIACKAGVGQRGILSSHGTAFAIECDIPTEDLCPWFRIDIWRRMMTSAFKARLGVDTGGLGREICFRVRRAVPPSEIVAFHELNAEDCELTSPRH